MNDDMKVDELEAGSRLDALVAEKVMKWQWNIRNGVCYAEHDCSNAADLWPQWQPSTDIAAAWEVHKHCCRWTFSQRRRYLDARAFEIQTPPIAESNLEFKEGIGVAFPNALMFLDPLPICRAALRAVKNESI